MEDTETDIDSSTYERAMDEAPVGIVITGPLEEDNPIIYVNDEFLDITGYERDEVIGRNCRFLQGPGTSESPVRHMREGIENEGIVTVELRNYRKDGTEFWNRVTVSPLYEEGEVTKYVGFQEEVTERVEREREMQEQKKVLDTVLSNVPVVLWAVDEDGVFTRSEGKALEKLDLEPGQVVGESVFEVYDDHPKIKEDCERALNGERVQTTVELNGVLFEGWYEPIFNDEGDVAGTVGLAYDVTERKQREKELKEKKEGLQRQNKRLERLRSTISHDIRTPLSVAVGRVELMKSYGEYDEESLDTVERSLNRIEELIDELLKLAQQGESVTESDTKTLSIEEVVGRCWENVDTQEAELEILVDTNFTLEADESRLARVFENLFKNSVEHGGEDVTVTVGELSEGEGFYVEDDGSGIPEEEHDEVFESGYTSKEEGTGFGLSIVEEIVDAHGWEVSLDESEEGGARFKITVAAQN